MIKKRLLPLLLVLSMTGVCLAGCGNGSSEQASSNPPGAEAETENSGAAETMEAAEEAEEEEEEYLSDIPEEEREAYGYYDCLEQTVSDAFVNLDLPVFVDRYGDIRVYLKLSSMAGSGVMWVPDYPFGMTMDGEGIG